MKKVLLIALVLLVVIAGFGVCYLASNLNSIVAGLIEKHGSEAVGTEVAVSGVDLSLREGRATLAGLSIASPDGYDAGEAFTLGEITVDMDLESLRDEPLVIDEIVVQAPVVSAEFLENGTLNIQQLQQNVQRFADSAGAGDGGTAGGGGDEDLKRIRIKRFVFEEGRINADASALGLEARTLVLPVIRLDDIGGAAGARPDQIAQAVLGALTKKAAAEVAKAGVEQKVRDMAEDEAKKQAEGLLDKISK
ncbi:MAG: hypothetical protein GY838_16805 [bacterium]|nr:hypothetical protein [bacterium]